ncbi:bifunctional lysozyme/C40 family peptidase [Peribacillus muralis]|uniref:bifunctional lytic transglycosylase/C40 family peptidase n=1 Tax=Peribacillus muralis TaxID=264697 RepID=UPI001F4E435C|nr:bifunctional lytic transglycosylase/C40 family peptidase [Peribacillus muralis]MCK1995449.1 bifunctional lysozyme/C40 family peptidase [Peribacillus muralis]MCK2016032.1 bifunctional lysozyme/C40 family peptidase [Peribacillus muralis]
MDVVTVKVALTIGQKVVKHWKKIVLIVLSFFMFLVIGVMMLVGGDSGNSGTAKVNDAVMAWKPVVSQYAEEYGVPDYVDVLLAIIMVETGGAGLDIMQSSESLGFPPNTITDPIVSINAGVKHFASVVKSAKSNGLDFWTPVQSYNFGSGFNNYVKSNGKQYSFDLASDFSKNLANGRKVKYSNTVADFNGNFRYGYGNMYYVLLVQQYLSPAGGGDIGNADASALGTEAYQNLMNEVMKYNGWPYVWGGSGPKAGFDCSGLVQYSFKKLGYNLPRTAAEQHTNSIPVAEPQPGDLVFFKGTNPSRPAGSITHVGIYVDKQRMYDANNGGVGYSNWNQGYWKQHFAGFGRVVK